MPRPRATGSEPCVICGAEHSLHMGTWIMTGNDQLLCANDSCWREAVKREIENSETLLTTSINTSIAEGANKT